MSLYRTGAQGKEVAVTQVLDRPTTEADVRTQTEVRPRPIELDREIRQLPPAGEPPGRFRWLGWLFGIAIVAAIAWLVIAEITTDDTAVVSQTPVVAEGAITADPKARMPVVTPEMVNESIQSGVPGAASLTEVSTLGQTPAESLEDATVNPMIYWAVPPTHATMMEEATVSPGIYHAAAPTVPQGAYWRYDVVLPEHSLLPEYTALPMDVGTDVLSGAYWRYDLVLPERPLFPAGLDLTFGIWPSMYAEPPVVDVFDYSWVTWGWADWPTYTPESVVAVGSHGGHLNIMD